MKRRIGPILHLRACEPKDWSFSVGLWLDTSDKPPTLAFDPAAKAVISALATAPDAFGGASWTYWNVTIARQNAELQTSYDIDGLDEGKVHVDDVVIPALGQSPRISYFSCNGVQDPRDWTTQPEMEVLWERMHARHRAGVCPDGSGGPYHVLLGGGDQIYCDSVWMDVPRLSKLDTWEAREKANVSEALVRDLEKHYAKLYLRWHESWFAELHSRVPGLYIWDDHDIFDGWGSYSEGLQASPVFRAIFAQARRAFVLFQLGGGVAAGAPCLDRTGAHFLQAVRLSEALDVVILDLRSQRTPTVVIGDDQWRALGAYLTERAARKPVGSHLLVVSTIPVVYLNFAAATTFFDWLPWRQDLEDDLRDHWEHKDHQEERARLIMTLLDHAAATKSRVTLLSGDVHVGARGRITSKRPSHLVADESETAIHQLTSSAIVFPAPSALALAGMRAVTPSGPAPLDAVSQVETEVLRVGADHFLLGERNWLSIEPGAAKDGERERLWVRWISEKGEVKPPILIHARQSK